MSVLKDEKTAGDCPVISRMLHDLKEKELVFEDIFLICENLKKI
jgi:hypothetical protein